MMLFLFQAMMDFVQFVHTAESGCHSCCLKGEFCNFETEMETVRFLFVTHSCRV